MRDGVFELKGGQLFVNVPEGARKLYFEVGAIAFLPASLFSPSLFSPSRLLPFSLFSLCVLFFRFLLFLLSLHL